MLGVLSKFAPKRSFSDSSQLPGMRKFENRKVSTMRNRSVTWTVVAKSAVVFTLRDFAGPVCWYARPPVRVMSPLKFSR